MSWIMTIDYEQAEGPLKRMYDRVKGPDNNIDNVLLIHSLRPHTLTGHMTLYKSVLHNSNNTLPKWFLEAMGVYVSHLNNCDYCVQHHFLGFSRLLDNDEKANQFFECIKDDSLETYFENHYLCGIVYARKLTLDLASITKQDIDELRSVGFTDGEILEINQVTSYFNYVNRMVVGLGVTTEGDIIGLSPNNSDDPKNWSHR
ncbi:MAG: peroxidase-related enzyme [Bacteroidetes bacterium]|nr:peroxidase-related enzyme [Bacteroidota bacterium]